MLGQQVVVTLLLLGLLGAVFLKGFKEAIELAVGILAVYLGFSLVVVGHRLTEVLVHPELLHGWQAALTGTSPSTLSLAGAALLIFPALALGFSRFETGVVAMSLVRGEGQSGEAAQPHP